MAKFLFNFVGIAKDSAYGPSSLASENVPLKLCFTLSKVSSWFLVVLPCGQSFLWTKKLLLLLRLDGEKDCSGTTILYFQSVFLGPAAFAPS